MPLEITDSNGFIKAGLSSDIMRLSMESKGILDKKGSVYVGTGEIIRMNYGAETVNIAKTTALSPGKDGEVLTLVSDGLESYEVKWGKITHEMIEDTQAIFSITVTKATQADSVTSSNLSTNVLYDSSQKNKAQADRITLEERLARLGI